ASFLRLYGITTTEFDADQADIFRMAHDAVIHGHLVATSNIASIGVYNPPGIIYALMIPAAFSANPIGGAIETALLAVFGVFLTLLVYPSLLWAGGGNNRILSLCRHLCPSFLLSLHVESEFVALFCATLYDRAFPYTITFKSIPFLPSFDTSQQNMTPFAA